MKKWYVLVPLLVLGQAAVAQEGWSWPARIKGDDEGGCLATKKLDDGKRFAVWANLNEGYGIGFVVPGAGLDPAKEYSGAVTFDNGPPVMLSGWALNSETVILDSGAEEDSVQKFINTSKSLKLTFEKTSAEVALEGYLKLAERLRECTQSE